jgi:hypothetical protein
MQRTRFLVAVAALWAVAGCTDPAADDTGRGSLGKADLFGSCANVDGTDSCGSISYGSCFCDDLCEDFDDCCADKAAVCDVAFDPCLDRACGAACKVCPPGDPNCFETTVEKFCDGDGQCKPGVPECLLDDPGVCPDPDDPRVHYISQSPLTCAAIFFICEPGQSLFGGNCGCGCIDPFDPCEGLSCGDECTLCPPEDLDCVETAEVKACSPGGECLSEVPMCE